MKLRALILQIVGLLIAHFHSAGADVLHVDTQRIALREFQIDVLDSTIKKVLQCSQFEVDRGVRQSSVHERFHRLSPSYNPARHGGAWLISNKSCLSLAPDLNGLGFAHYDAGSGEGLIYVTLFTETSLKKLDSTIEFSMANTIFLPARCRITGSNWIDRTAAELTCRFDDRKGRVVFDIQNDLPVAY